MKTTGLVLLGALLPGLAVAAELPRVAPPGPGTSAPSRSAGHDDLKEKFGRRLDADEPAKVSPRPAAPSVIYRRPGGAETDTGLPLTGRGDVLRDPQSGVWNCTAGGCFSPEGSFVPMKKQPPPAATGAGN